MKVSVAAVGAMLLLGADAAFVGQRFAANKPTILPQRSLFMAASTDTSEDVSPPLVKEATKTEKEETFVNDGLFSWMDRFMFLHEEGKSLAYAMPVAADETKKSSPEQVAQEKKEYSDKLMNIGMDERQRRQNASEVFAAITAAYVVWAALIADQGDMGRWEVDGVIQSIDDPSLARAILDKVNKSNVETGVQAIAASAIFAFLPQSTSAPLVFFAAIFAALYFIEGKLPSQE